MIATLWLLVGFIGGSVHFALLRWNVALYLPDRHGRPCAGHPRLPCSHALLHAVTLQLFRLAAIALLLGVAAWQGALPLLLAALGVVLARPLMMHVMRVVP
jgi:hypothetical protein